MPSIKSTLSYLSCLVSHFHISSEMSISETHPLAIKNVRNNYLPVEVNFNSSVMLKRHINIVATLK